METLDPGNADGARDKELELSQANSDIEALVAMSESIASQEQSKKQQQALSRRRRPSAPAPAPAPVESEEITAGLHTLNVPRFVAHANMFADAQMSKISTPPSTSPFVGRTVTDILRSKAKYKTKGGLTLVTSPVGTDQPMSHIQRDIAERGLPETTPTGPKRKRDARDDYGSPSLKEMRIF
jgi:hypothetical protein